MVFVRNICFYQIIFVILQKKNMTKLINEAQYNWAVTRVEELLPLVTDETPLTAPESIELQLLSNLVADYSDEHFSIDNLTNSTNETEKSVMQNQHNYTNIM